MTHPLRFIFDGRPVEFSSGDTVLLALLRAGLHPAKGGCLCLAGDCPNCLTTIDGVSYTRSCQTKAMPGMVVAPHPADALPQLPQGDLSAPETKVRHVHCDVVVIGMGESGRAAADAARSQGKRVATLDAQQGQSVIGIYAGPLVVARTAEGMLQVRPSEEIVVATGAAEIQPVVPGNLLAGIYTARAAEKLTAAGLDLGRIFRYSMDDELLRIEGTDRVTGVVIRGEQGEPKNIPCDSVVADLGLSPRSGLYRMGSGLPVRVTGDAAREPALPSCPRSGTVCPCSAVTVEDLESVWERGFHELDLVKRATLAGTGPCQGSVCVPHIRSFLADRGGRLQPSFTSRPVSFQLTIGEAAAGGHHHAVARTALDAEHRSLGAHMERTAGWWRPWTYSDPLQEYWAVREAVSVCDISTLGKFFLRGPDALELLERLYPTHVGTLKPGRSRYVLLLNERGYVIDDGMILRDSADEFYLTFTSGGSTNAELWMRDWIETWGLDVRLMNQTMALGAINVTGPLATELIAQAGVADPPRYLEHKNAEVCGVQCRMCRLSFTGEISYELHHAASESVGLWRNLLALGQSMGIKPHGLETMFRLRLEKGHILVGQDSDFDSTPRRLHHEWAVKLDKPDFVGKDALLRTNKLPLDRQLAAFTSPGNPPGEGAVLWIGDEYAGYITSSAWSPVLGKSVMLGWLRLVNGALPDEVTVAGLPAQRVQTPIYDPEGHRARA